MTPFANAMDARVLRFQQFYRRENERPLLGFFLGSEFPLFRYPAAGRLPARRPLRPDDLDVEAFVEDTVRLFEQHEECGGDFLFAGSAFWGVPWVEAILGCPIYCDPTTGAATSRPPEGVPATRDIPRWDPANPWIVKLGEFLERLALRSDGDWPIGTTRMRGIGDLLAALYGSDRFILAMLEQPHEITSLCSRLTDLWIQIGRFQLDRIPLFHGGVGSFYYHAWAPPGTIWYQEDAASLLSPSLFDRFIRPCTERIVAAFDHVIVHLHPSGFVPIDSLLEAGVTAVELHVDENGPSVQELQPLHARIVRQRPLLIWGRLDEHDLRYVFEHVASAGLAVMARVSGPTEARRLWETLRDQGQSWEPRQRSSSGAK